MQWRTCLATYPQRLSRNFSGQLVLPLNPEVISAPYSLAKHGSYYSGPVPGLHLERP